MEVAAAQPMRAKMAMLKRSLEDQPMRFKTCHGMRQEEEDQGGRVERRKATVKTMFIFCVQFGIYPGHPIRPLLKQSNQTTVSY